jgi:hypothetical protein
MQKIDFKKTLKQLYAASDKAPVLVEVPAMNFLMVDGKGDPNITPSFQRAVEALYSASYTLKFMIKKGKGAVDYTVPPLEGLWWTDSMRDFSIQNKGIWKWTVMIMQPEFITEELFRRAAEELVRKKKDLPLLASVRLEEYDEGPSAQIMHRGPFSTEGPTIARLHAFIGESGHQLRGKHHEIYLSDPRKAKPATMKTILRQPVKE